MIDFAEHKRLMDLLPKLLPTPHRYFPWKKHEEKDIFSMVDGQGVIVDEEKEIDYALHAINNYAALVERCEKAEADLENAGFVEDELQEVCERLEGERDTFQTEMKRLTDEHLNKEV